MKRLEQDALGRGWAVKGWPTVTDNDQRRPSACRSAASSRAVPHVTDSGDQFQGKK
jgi:hypothetical protein